MRKIELGMNELEKYEVIKKLVDTNGYKHRAANKLDVTLRTINRLIKKYKEGGKAGFIHGNRGRVPSSAISLRMKKQIIENYENKYYIPTTDKGIEIFMKNRIFLVNLSTCHTSIIPKKYTFFLIG